MTKKWFHKTNIKENTEDRTEFELIFQCRRKVYILSTSTEIKIMLCRIADHEVKKVLTASVFAKRFSSARKLNGLQCRAVKPIRYGCFVSARWTMNIGWKSVDNRKNSRLFRFNALLRN